jgi:hypothetical protein
MEILAGSFEDVLVVFNLTIGSKGKGKVHSVTSHEGPEGEQM